MTEYEKMIAGEPFNPADRCFFWMMLRAEILQRMLNRTPLWLQGRRDRLMKRLFGSLDGRPYCVYLPLRIVYGRNIHAGRNLFLNYNCTLLDYAPITIGNDVWIGANTVIATVQHPLSVEKRNVRRIAGSMQSGGRGNWEYAKPITIGNNVIIYSCAMICPGVTIGDNSVIGAGSVVTRDIPANVLALGTPCRVVREITEEERMDRQAICKAGID